MDQPPEDSPEWDRPRVGFVRPPPAPPPTAQELRFEPLVTISGWLMFIGLLLMFSGCGLVITFAASGWGPIGLAGGATGIGVLAIAVVLRWIARWLQRRPAE